MYLHVVWGLYSPKGLSYQLFLANGDGEKGMAFWLLCLEAELVSRK